MIALIDIPIIPKPKIKRDTKAGSPAASNILAALIGDIEDSPGSKVIVAPAAIIINEVAIVYGINIPVIISNLAKPEYSLVQPFFKNE